MTDKPFDLEAWRLAKFGAEVVDANKAAAAEMDARLARRRHMIVALRAAGYSVAEADSLISGSPEACDAVRSDSAMHAFLAAETQA